MKLASVVLCLSKISSETLNVNTTDHYQDFEDYSWSAYSEDEYNYDSDLNSTFYSSSSSSSFDIRIAGGHEPLPHSHPFMAMMLYHQGSYPVRKCGGSILNENWILTAAHCCEMLPEKKKIEFRIGAHRDEGCNQGFCDNKNSIHGPESGANDLGSIIYVKNKLIHPEYKRFCYNRGSKCRLKSVKNDFCLIETNTKMNFGRHVGKISIADEDFTTKGKRCFVLGWGYTERRLTSKYLQKLKTEKTRRRYTHCKTVEENNAFCMDNKHTGTCFGDSGGPLFCEKDGQNFLVGVTSYGHDRCPSPFGVYGDVRKVNSWISKNISKRMKPLRTPEKCFTGFRIETKFEKRGRSKSSAVNSECDCVKKCRKDWRCRAFTFVTGRRKNCHIKTRLYRSRKEAEEKDIIFGIKLTKQ